MGEKVFDKNKWYKHYTFKAEFGKYFSLVVGQNTPHYVKYYKGNDAKRVFEDAKNIMQKKGWNYAEVTDKSNDEIGIIKADGKLHAYKKGSEYWGLKTEEGFKNGGNLNNFEYTIGGL